MTPLVSIITVCYNSEKTIERTIRSVLNQTYKNIEYVVVDGASTDNTLNIVKKYEPFFEGRMKWISEPDDGIYYAMNKGIDMSRGEVIGLLNSDDTYETDAIEKIIMSLTNNRYQILYGFARVYKEDKMDSISIVSHDFLPDRMFNHSASFVTRSVYTELGKFDTKYISVADYDFMLRMFNSKKVEFIPVYSLVSNFYSGGMSSTNRAYMDLLKLKKDYNMISKFKYYKYYLQHVLLSIINCLLKG